MFLILWYDHRFTPLWLCMKHLHLYFIIKARSEKHGHHVSKQSFETVLHRCVFICVSVFREISAVNFGHQCYCFKYVLFPRLTKLSSILLCNVRGCCGPMASGSPITRCSSPLSAVHKVSFDPVADLSIFKRCDSHSHVKFLRCAVTLHPLMPRKHTYHLSLPALSPAVPHPGVNPWAAGSGLRVAVLIQQVRRLLAGPTEAVHQLARPVIVKPREVDPAPGKPLSRGADAQPHVLALVGFLEFEQGVVVIHPNLIRVAFNPPFGDVCAFGSDPLELHFGVGWRGVGGGATFHMVREVGWWVCVLLFRFKKTNPKLLGSFHIVFTVMNTMCSGEDVAVPHQCTRAAGGQFDRHWKRVFEQKVLTCNAETPIVSKDLSLFPHVWLCMLPRWPRRVGGAGVGSGLKAVDPNSRLGKLAIGVESLIGQKFTQVLVGREGGLLVAFGVAGRSDIEACLRQEVRSWLDLCLPWEDHRDTLENPPRMGECENRGKEEK